PGGAGAARGGARVPGWGTWRGWTPAASPPSAPASATGSSREASTSPPPRSRTRCTVIPPSTTWRCSACPMTTGASGFTPRCACARATPSPTTTCAPLPGSTWPTTRCRARSRSPRTFRATAPGSSSSGCSATHTGPGTTGRSDAGSGLLQAEHVEGGNGPGEALQRQNAQLFELDQRLDRPEDALRDQDLAGLRLAAEPRGHVGHGADRPVVHSALEADRADGRVTLIDPDAEVELVAAPAPLCEQLVDLRAHPRRHPHGALRRVGHRHRVV